MMREAVRVHGKSNAQIRYNIVSRGSFMRMWQWGIHIMPHADRKVSELLLVLLLVHVVGVRRAAVSMAKIRG